MNTRDISIDKALFWYSYNGSSIRPDGISPARWRAIVAQLLKHWVFKNVNELPGTIRRNRRTT